MIGCEGGACPQLALVPCRALASASQLRAPGLARSEPAKLHLREIHSVCTRCLSASQNSQRSRPQMSVNMDRQIAVHKYVVHALFTPLSLKYLNTYPSVLLQDSRAIIFSV